MLEALLAVLIGVLFGLLNVPIVAIPMLALFCTAIYISNNSHLFGIMGAWNKDARALPGQVSKSFLLCFVVFIAVLACGCASLAFGVARFAVLLAGLSH